MKNFLANSALALFSLFVTFMILEVGVRYTLPTWYPQGAFSADPAAGYINSPSFDFRLKSDEFDVAVSTNSLGFRDDPYDSNDLRPSVLAVGDSFCWGFGVEIDDDFLSIVEKKSGMKIHKACACGYGTLQALEIVKNKGPLLHPKIVLLNFFLGNDFYENMSVRNLTVKNGYFYEEPPAKSSLFHKALTHLRNRSRLFEFAIAKIKRSITLYSFLKKLGLTGEKLVDEIDLYRREEKPAVTRAYETTTKLISQMKETSENIGAVLKVVIIPTKNQVDPKTFSEGIKRAGEKLDNFDLSRPANRLTAILDKMKIEYINLLPEFRDGGKYYFDKDPHFNANGHRKAAAIINEHNFVTVETGK